VKKLLVVLFLLVCGSVQASGQTTQSVAPFVEPNDGRTPLTAALDQATQSIDIYVFILTLPSDDPIVNSLRAAAARGVTARAVVEPCPGEGASCVPPNPDAQDACAKLIAAGVAVKWANPAFPKTHAKTTLLDNSQALVTTVNLEPRSFTVRRDYGVLTDDPGVVGDFARVFAQDWGTDDPVSNCTRTPSRLPDAALQDYSTLVVTPDNGRQAIIGTADAPGLVRSAQATLQIEMEKIDPQESRGVIPALRDAIQHGVHVQVLLKAGESDNVEAAGKIIAAGGEARCRPDLHAKLIIADGQQVFLGSQNLTRDSLDLRREIGWVLTDSETLSRFSDTFSADWAAAGSC
jgi:phosphatidylserine/phosphatidylglycerophosphate/cardiolipin synthase-like enzyme